MSDKAIKTGQCLCGNISYKLKSDPQMTVLCHCKNCQRQAGSVLSIIAGVPQGDVEISGEVKTYNDSGDSGGDVLRQFCPECGSPMFTLADQAPGLIFIKAGTLDDTSWLEPSVQFYTKSKQHWLELDGIPGFEGNPPAA